MKYQRVFLEPLRRFTRADLTPHDGIPPTWDREILPSLPDGQDWFEIHAQPIAGEDYDPATQRIARVLNPITKRDGWQVIDLTPEEIAAAKPKPQPVTKLTIMNRLVGAGKWEAFKSILSQAPAIAQDAWLLAQDIRSDDPIFIAHADIFKTGLDMTEEQFQSLLRP